MDINVRIIASDSISEFWNSFFNSEGKTVCVVIVYPNFRVLVGNPMDESIVGAKVNKKVLARYALSQMRLDALNRWQPEMRPQ